MIFKLIILEDFDLDNILIDKKSHENILIYDISYKTLIGAKPFCLRFDKIDGPIRVYDGIRYLILFGSENYDTIYNTIFNGNLISLKSRITYVFCHYYTKLKFDSYGSLPKKKILTLHNVIILL